jgi:DNA-directed RNA polymerase specialized sigma24 family protein
METLTPTERPVFVLREVFALDYDEIDTVVAVERETALSR